MTEAFERVIKSDGPSATYLIVTKSRICPPEDLSEAPVTITFPPCMRRKNTLALPESGRGRRDGVASQSRLYQLCRHRNRIARTNRLLQLFSVVPIPLI